MTKKQTTGSKVTRHQMIQLLNGDLANERKTVGRHRECIQPAEARGEFALRETRRGIIAQEQEHEIDLCAALGINVPAA